MDGLTAVLEDRPPGEPVKLTEVRRRIPRLASSRWVTEVLADLELLEDDSALAIRSWIDHRTSEELRQRGIRHWSSVTARPNGRKR
jgi:hypothetical protein